MKGWECPKCGKCWAFWVKSCDCHLAKKPKEKQVWRLGIVSGDKGEDR